MVLSIVRVFVLLALAATMVVGGPARAQGASFAQRLAALEAATDRHLNLVDGEAARFPSMLRRLAWLTIEGDRHPDALVILKPQKGDCAALARRPQPCRGLVLLGRADGGFDVATEFRLGDHPLVLLKDPRGMVTALYHASVGGADAPLNRYVLREGHFVPGGDAAPLSQLLTRQVLVLDDRALPLWADQSYAASQFDNARAKLAPFRLHIDEVNTNAGLSAVRDELFAERVGYLVNGLTADARKLVEAVGWHQTLDLRLWSCNDWMVPRRFWEVEDLRMGRVGLCVEPAVFALRQGLVPQPADFLALARQRLLQEVGVAYLLRAAPITEETRQQLKQPASREQLVFMGAAAGMLLGQMLQLQAPEAALALQARWRAVSARWFSVVEQQDQGYFIKSPELRAFDHDLDVADQAMRCTLKLLGGPAASRPPAACPNVQLQRIDALRSALRQALAP